MSQNNLFCYRVMQFLFFHFGLELDLHLVAHFGEFRDGVRARRFDGLLQVFNAVVCCTNRRQLRFGGRGHDDLFVGALYDINRFVRHRD